MSDLGLYPLTASATDGVLRIAGLPASELAAEFGTPLYVYDLATLEAAAHAYQRPLSQARGGGRAHFAAKANATPAILAALRGTGMGVDVASAGEIAAARLAGFRGEDMVVHGNAKTTADLDAALAAEARLIVLDSADEARALAERARALGRDQVRVLVRVKPGLDVTTHEKIATGHTGSKFGLAPRDVPDLVTSLDERLAFAGLHTHLGSQVVDPGELRRAFAVLEELTQALRRRVDVLDLGGGLGVAYDDGDRAPDPAMLARAMVDAVDGLPDPPELLLEPGRSVCARAGITLYRVVSVKRGDRHSPSWVNLDGGMGDNPRVALYGSRYSFALADRFGTPATEVFHLGGHHCESGDRLAEDRPLPEPRPGDLVVCPVTGAYHQSLASTYNMFGRPAAVLVGHGQASLISRRETIADLLSRELPMALSQGPTTTIGGPA